MVKSFGNIKNIRIFAPLKVQQPIGRVPETKAQLVWQQRDLKLEKLTLCVRFVIAGAYGRIKLLTAQIAP